MIMHPVSSSNIASIGWGDNILYVEFSYNNRTYRYANVPRYVYEELMNAHSHGKYFAEYIKPKYTCLY